MDKERQLIMTIGLPYAGKKTWSQQHGAPIVSPDAIRLALHGQRFAYQAEPFVWAIAGLMVHSLFEIGHTDVILEACNVTKKRRDEWKHPRWKRRYIVLDVCAAVCFDRAREAKDHEIVPIIERMAGNLEYDGVFYGDSGDTALMKDFVSFPGRDALQVFHAGTAND